MREIAISLMAVAVMAACKVNKKETVQRTARNEKKDSIACKTLVLDAERMNAGVTDAYTIMDARMNGPKLEIDVQYGGGCGEATFDLVWNGALMKSLPPKANIVLLMKDDDPCRALVTKTVCFDVSSVYKGECVLLLKDFRGQLVYKSH